MKNKKTLFWIATIILLLWEGLMPLVSVMISLDNATIGTRPLGYPDYFTYALMVCKILGVIAIALPQTPRTLREWAYAGLSFNLLFAFYSHAVVNQNIGFMVLPLIIFAFLMVSYAYSPYKNT